MYKYVLFDKVFKSEIINNNTFRILNSLEFDEIQN